MPARRATARAVWALSPVSITTSTPSVPQRGDGRPRTRRGSCRRRRSHRARRRRPSARRRSWRPPRTPSSTASSAGLQRWRSSARRWLPRWYRTPSTVAATPRPGIASKSVTASSGPGQALDDGVGDRVLGPGVDRRGEPPDVVGVPGLGHDVHVGHDRAAVGERAGLVEGDDAARGGPARGGAPPLMRMPRRAAPPSPATTVTGVEMTERARAGEHEQHEGPVEPLVEAAEAEQHGHASRWRWRRRRRSACRPRRSGRRSAAPAPARPGRPGSSGRCGRACRRRAPPSPARRSCRAG